MTIDKLNGINIEDSAQQLKVKVMHYVKNGSLSTEAISKKLFKEYQDMGRDRARFEDHIKTVDMYNDSNVRTQTFSSIEAYEYFKSLEK